VQGGKFLEYNNENWNSVLVSICNILGEKVSKYGSNGNYNAGSLSGLA